MYIWYQYVVNMWIIHKNPTELRKLKLLMAYQELLLLAINRLLMVDGWVVNSHEGIVLKSIEVNSDTHEPGPLYTNIVY